MPNRRRSPRRLDARSWWRDRDLSRNVSKYVGRHDLRCEGAPTATKRGRANHLFCCELELGALYILTLRDLSKPGAHADPPKGVVPPGFPFEGLNDTANFGGRSNQRSDLALSPSVKGWDGVQGSSAGHAKRRPLGTHA